MKILVIEPENQYNSADIFLCGRNISAESMSYFAKIVSPSTLKIVIQPYHFQWYPAPNGPFDQDAALNGIKRVVGVLQEKIKFVEDVFKIPTEKTNIIGYSAGAVMALKIASLTTKKWNKIIAISGAILDVENLKPAIVNNDIYVLHNRDDNCFDWLERYIPTKYALIKNGYNAKFVEGNRGGHDLSMLTVHQLEKIL